METRFCKEDPEPMLKQEFSFEDTLLYQDEEDHEPFIKVENEECIKGMIVSEHRPQTPPRPTREWRDNAIVSIERQSKYDRLFQSKVPSNERAAAAATVDPFHPQNYCVMCDRTFARQDRFRSHIRRVHLLTVRYFKHPYETIDPNHPDNYCAKCGRNYTDKYFPKHLHDVHGIIVEAPKLGTPRKRRNDGRGKKSKRPSHHRPYCAMCRRSYSKGYYRRHLRAIHGLREDVIKRLVAQSKRDFLARKMAKAKGTTKKRPHVSVELLTDCTRCNRTYSSRVSFLQHLKTKAHSDGITMSIKYPNAEIDIFHPDYFCAKCDRAYASAHTFWCHLERNHLSTLCNTRSAVKISNKRAPIYYCPKCDRYYTEDIFKQHFTNHRTSKPVIMNPDAEIDFNSPDFYCARCDKHYASQESFKTHIIWTHNLAGEWYQAVRERKVAHPEAEIDFSDADNYCAKCDKKWKARAMLLEHAAIMHGVYPPSMGEGRSDHGPCNLRNGKKVTPLIK